MGTNSKLKILVVGGGGREHTLVWKLAQSSRIDRIFCAPGNAGISRLAACVPLKVEDIAGIVDFSRKERVDLVVVGPELPLTHGLVDALEEAGIKAFGPGKKAAEIEGSKAFAKDLMRRYGIPTARYGVFTEIGPAKDFAREMPSPWVIKADGLAGGKGVVICETLREADEAIERALTGQAVGKAGETIVIEEYLEGEELSILAFCDGTTAIPMVPAQDHKRIFDGDQGPNTGGMGAYSPVPAAKPALMREIEEKILHPVIKAMAKEGRPYRGVLYPGLMLTKEGPKVLEFNCRFGDPETQVVLPRLQSDLAGILLDAVEGRLHKTKIEWRPEACITVVMASGGYPGSYRTGYPISGLIAEMPENVIVFHSGTAWKDQQIVTAGGRVLSLTALGRDIAQARTNAYEAINRISFKDCHYRKDIAYRALT